MEFFYFTEDILLNIPQGNISVGHQFKAMPRENINQNKISSQFVYFGTIDDLIKIKLALSKSSKNNIIQVFSIEQKKIFTGHPAFPLNIGFKAEDHQKLFRLFEKTNDFTNKTLIKIAVINGMGTGLGDSIVGLTALKIFFSELQKYFTNIEIVLFQTYMVTMALFYNQFQEYKKNQLPNISSNLFYFDAYINLEGMTNSPLFNSKCLIDFYLESLSIPSASIPPTEKRNNIKFNIKQAKDMQTLVKSLKSSRKRLLLFHPISSDKIRTMPNFTINKAIDFLSKETDYLIISLVPSEIENQNLIDLSAISTDYHKFAYLISQMDLIITVDTSVYHIADGFGIPTLVLFTSIEPKLRNKYYPTVESIYLDKKPKSKIRGKHKLHNQEEELYVNNIWKQFSFDLLQKKMNQLEQKYLINQKANYETNDDLISVITPVYNSAPYLAKTIQSVLNQTITNLELILINDGSTDSSEQIIFDFQTLDNRIKYLFQKNQGPGAARNKGIQAAKGKYVAFLDADDMLLPYALGTMIFTMNQNPNIHIVYGDYFIFNKNKNTKELKQMPLPEGKPQLFGQFLQGNFISMNSVMIKKQALTDVGLFDEALRLAEDFDLWARMSIRYNFKKIDIPLSIYNFHKNQSIKNIADLRYYTDLACYKYWNLLKNQNLFPNIKNDKEIANSLENLAKKMLVRIPPPYGTILCILDAAQHTYHSKERNEFINSLRKEEKTNLRISSELD